MTNARARLLWTSFAFIVIVTGTLIAIRLAKGYRPSSNTLVQGNGLLVANSSPKGARLLLNGRFTTATDDTLYLEPGTYDVEIQNDGYFPWKKKLEIQRELVTQANALLFPLAPSLSPFTYSGAQNPTPSPDGQRIAFYTASSSAQTKNGFYVVELTDNPISLQRGPRQIAEPSSLFPVDSTEMLWSPNSSQLLLISPQKTVLLDPTRLTRLEDLADISLQLPQILSQWEEEMYLRDRERLALFPPFIQNIATSSAVNVYFSPDEKKLLYTATSEFSLPENILPAKLASNSQEQERATTIGGMYVYDRDEDRQFRVDTDRQYLETLKPAVAPSPTPRPRANQVVETPQPLPFNPQKLLLSTDLSSTRPLSLAASPSAFRRLQGSKIEDTVMLFRTYHSPLFSHAVQWFPNSAHLIAHDASGVTIKEYDNANAVRVFSGPFDPSFVYPWPNGSRLIILTNFNQGTMVPFNLYGIDLR